MRSKQNDDIQLTKIVATIFTPQTERLSYYHFSHSTKFYNFMEIKNFASQDSEAACIFCIFLN